jgi:SWIM/SEC-C metal-binding protein
LAKLGTEEHPAIVRLQSQERAAAVYFGCIERGWHVIAGVEPDKPEDLTDIELLLYAEKPVQKVGRNDVCPCGSGKKFKKCCIAAPSPAQLWLGQITPQIVASTDEE